jgi:hypothetical protein
MVPKMLMQSSLVLYQECYVGQGIIHRILFWEGNKQDSVIVNGRWKMRGVTGKNDKGSCPFYLGKKDVKTGSELSKLLSSASVLILGFSPSPGNCPLEPVKHLTTQASNFRL